MNKYIIAVDGPSAAGKSYLSRSISQKLGIIYIDTGAMYRAVALYFIQKHFIIQPQNQILLNFSQSALILPPLL